jgi:hypothetical protein
VVSLTSALDFRGTVWRADDCLKVR